MPRLAPPLKIEVLLFILIFLVLTACTSQASPSPSTPTPSGAGELALSTPAPALPTALSSNLTAAETPVTGELGAASIPDAAPEVLPNTQYTLTAVLDYWNHHLAVDQQIHYVNHSPDTLQELLLVAEPANYPGVFQLNSIAWANGESIPFDQDLSRLRLPLPQPLAPGASLHLSVAYELSLPSPIPSAQTRPVPFGYTANQTNLVDWYPYIPPYVSGQGWLSHPPGFFGEHQVYETSDFKVSVKLLDRRPEMTIAASAPAEVDGDWQRYDLKSARNFVWSVSHTYQVLTQTVGDVTVLGYAFPAHALAGERALKTTAEALALFSELYGPYPHSTLSVVEADFLDGMEFDGMYFLSKGFYNLYTGTPGEYLTAIAAHETAHEWFYAQVGNDQAMEPWLDEALSTYSERIFYERTYPEALDWWWAYRVNYYAPQGWVDGSIYDFGGFPSPYRSYRAAVYLNGAMFLEDLRKLTGDEAFFDFLKDYVARYRGQLATGQGFLALLREHTQADVTPLLETYFQKLR